MDSMGFVLEEEEVSLYAGEGRKMGFLAAAYRAAGVDLAPARPRVTK